MKIIKIGENKKLFNNPNAYIKLGEFEILHPFLKRNGKLFSIWYIKNILYVIKIFGYETRILIARDE